ncbi:MAG: adenylate/guanylate cyclase domain-containing protein [Salaquimonas sp.]|jgi:adenylate cyclase|nr:adenylate/guanylate cyclase domain-containing protein [Salaquimonas sp.]
MSHQALARPIREWLIDQALGQPDIAGMFDTMCQRLAGIGIPIARARLVWPTLHPLFRSETVVWDRGKPARLEQFQHQDQVTKAWLESPFRYVMESDADMLRRELQGPNETLDFPLLKELKAAGITDYLVLATSYDQVVEEELKDVRERRGIIVSWASDRANGFSSDDLECLQQMQRIFALACKTAIQHRISTNIAITYLGTRAGHSVLNGKIRRGDGQHTPAVVWFSDLRGSTAFAENLPSDAYFSLLNAYFESTAGSVVEQGGEVLDFIGDAVLGIFPFQDESELEDAARRANAALDQTIVTAANINKEREAQGLERFKFGVGLNVGEVKFGNIGIPQRLTFSVVGHTVNEAARIESMTKLLQQPVLSGAGLAKLNPERWRSVGTHKLDGVLDPVELFAFNGCAAKAA